ncbi:MAG TPA: hypothetical protein VK667_10140 [Ktedonobacteraceae bacterium]|nr:hypothetical protein [Ktedonobacteraceae bacterium]
MVASDRKKSLFANDRDAELGIERDQVNARPDHTLDVLNRCGSTYTCTSKGRNANTLDVLRVSPKDIRQRNNFVYQGTTLFLFYMRD